MEQTAICFDCKYCKFESIPDVPCADLYCKKEFTIDTITEFKTYLQCKDARISINGNINEDCKYYEPSLMKKIKTKIKQLWQSIIQQ